jgi:hypothetical protein
MDPHDRMEPVAEHGENTDEDKGDDKNLRERVRDWVRELGPESESDTP